MIDQHEIPLRAELAGLGRPRQVHPVTVTSTSLVLYCAGVFFLLAAGLCVFIYCKVPFKKDDPTPPETMLYIAGGVAGVGLLCLWGAWWKGDLGKRPGDGYLLYPEALVLLENEACQIVRWNEITALLSPAGSSGVYGIATLDAGPLPIRWEVKHYSGLICGVVARVTNAIIPPLQIALQAGETVTFGPFEVRRDSIGYKGKILAWENVAVLRVEIGSLGRRLR